MSKKRAQVKIYHGYGHTHNLVVYGHVFKYRAKAKQRYKNGLFVNLMHVFKLFVLKPYPFAKVRLSFNGQQVITNAAYDGFFKFEWAAEKNVGAGWHEVNVTAFNEEGKEIATSSGKLYIPHITQYAFISDIDDTMMVSYSKTIAKRLKELLLKNPRTRKTFQSTRAHYELLANAHTTVQQPNPFFYVSSSEWNLYDYLVETFRFNGFPEGTFLLNQLKRCKDLLKTGKTGHEGKLMRIMRIIDAFPNQKFVFFGDNSQKDTEIYAKIAQKYGENVIAIYIRNVRKSKLFETQKILNKLEDKNISTCIFEHSKDAIAHSKKIGLIN
ncbi:App1 family protein [Pedobacter sp. UBA4863]|uniref:App1 family protein n=1 Tax=Pedobacter sp. UBA4863 TaxID=1947060 RepID=UPI0025FE872D|nr:App1 family protein [Pedobacter sp. UBA4863]